MPGGGGPGAGLRQHMRQPDTRRRVLGAAMIILVVTWAAHQHGSGGFGSSGSPLRSASPAELEQPAELPRWLSPAVANWTHPLPADLLDQGMIYWGDEGQEGPSRRLAKKLLAGKPISMGTPGGWVRLSILRSEAACAAGCSAYGVAPTRC